MAYRDLELTLVSARDLKNVNLFMPMDVYAVASISSDPRTRQRTPTDTSAGRNPSWNTTLRFSVPPSSAAAKAAGGGWLHVLICSERALGDKEVGEVDVPLAELLAGADGPGPQTPRLASYQVHTVLQGKPRGVLNVSYRLGPIVAPVPGDKPPVWAYPTPQQPFKPQNPAPMQPPYQTQNPAPMQPPYQPQNPAPTQPPYKYSPPHNPDPRPPRPPRHEEALSPTNGKRDGHGTIYMGGPHTQIIFRGGGPPSRSDIIPAKADGTRPKPSYSSSQPIKSSGKADLSLPKAVPQHQDDPTWPNAYSVNLSNPMPPTKADHHQSGPKSTLQQYDGMPSLPTAKAR